MAYTQKIWKNRQSEYPNRRVLTPTGNADEYDVARSEGVVVEEGDLLDADNLNDLESRIKAGFEEKADIDTGIQLYTHSSGTLTGSGTNGRVKATKTATYTSFTINGTSYSVRAGEDTSVDFVSGVWYTFVLDTQAKTINFKSGGGVSNSKLTATTAVAADVLNGKTFYSGNKTLKTGTALLVPIGMHLTTPIMTSATAPWGKLSGTAQDFLYMFDGSPSTYGEFNESDYVDFEFTDGTHQITGIFISASYIRSIDLRVYGVTASGTETQLTTANVLASTGEKNLKFTSTAQFKKCRIKNINSSSSSAYVQDIRIFFK